MKHSNVLSILFKAPQKPLANRGRKPRNKLLKSML